MTQRLFEKMQPDIVPSAYINPSAQIIGDVSIGADSSVWPLTVLRGDVHHIKIGERSNIQDLSVGHVTHAHPDYEPNGLPLLIGNDVTVGHRVILHACRIDDLVLVGMGAVIMDGAHVESNVVIGAGSLVPPGKVLTSGYLWLGAPVQQKRALTDEELAYFKYSAQHYVKLKDQYLSDQG